jgi:tryptophan-rich sensory protein
MDSASWLALGVFVAVNFAAASSGAVFKPGAWYANLRKPGWIPPNWAFPAVWSVLFCMNAAAGWLVWETAGAQAAPALAVYGVSLVLNAAWSLLFFGLRRMDWALAEVGVFWLSLAAVIAAFAPIRPLAALLLLPYLAWVSIAALLNLRMLQLNRPEPAAA